MGFVSSLLMVLAIANMPSVLMGFLIGAAVPNDAQSKATQIYLILFPVLILAVLTLIVMTGVWEGADITAMPSDILSSLTTACFIAGVIHLVTLPGYFSGQFIGRWTKGPRTSRTPIDR